MKPNNLLIHNNFYGAIANLSDEKAGKLFKAIFTFHMTGEYQKNDDVVDFAFQSIKPLIEENQEQYALKCQKNRENVAKRWNTNEYDRIQSNTNYTNIKEDNIKEDNIKEDNIKEDNIKEDNIKEDNIKEDNIKEDNIKEKSIINNTKKENLDFIRDDFKPVYQEWLTYRKEIKKPLKETSIKANYNQLLKLANNDLETAKAIINQSIANGWQGLFPLKQQNSYGKKYDNEFRDENGIPY